MQKHTIILLKTKISKKAGTATAVFPGTIDVSNGIIKTIETIKLPDIQMVGTLLQLL